MGQLTVTLPDNLEDEVRTKVRDGKYGSVSDFVRDAIKNELTHRPSYWERFIAVHVLENNMLLKEITNNQNWGSDELLEAMRRGYSNNYSDSSMLVSYDELPKDQTDFVQDVLEMFGELQRSFDQYGKGDKELAKNVEFEGFDGNSGDGYLGFTNFLVDNGKFTYVRPLDKMPHLNSHRHVNSVYKRMVDEYNAIKSNREPYEYGVLTLEEAKRIIAARIHPDQRSKV